MTTPTFTAPPTAPSRSDLPAAFIARANAFIAWFATHVAELVIAVGWLADQVTTVVADAASALSSANTASAAATAATSVSTLFATSSTSLALTTGAKAISYAEAGRTFANGDDVYLVRRSDRNARMHGAASLVDNTAKTMTVTVASGGVAGSGSGITDWMVIHGALLSLAEAVGADVLAATSVGAMTPKAMRDALAPYALTDAATVTPDGHNGLDFTWTIGGNRTLGAITNTYPGARGKIRITQDGTGSRILAVASAWKRQGGLATLSTAPGAIDFLEYEVDQVDGAGTATYILYDLLFSPS